MGTTLTVHRDVCKACRQNRGLVWCSVDDLMWENSEVQHCPATEDEGMLYSVQWQCRSGSDASQVKPPEGCLCVMEHYVMSQRLAEPPGG